MDMSRELDATLLEELYSWACKNACSDELEKSDNKLKLQEIVDTIRNTGNEINH